MSRALSSVEKKYNTEFLLCDEFWAFHPEFFDVLTLSEREALFAYYPQDLTQIPNVFAYRRKLLRRDPRQAMRARALLGKVLGPVGVSLPE